MPFTSYSQDERGAYVFQADDGTSTRVAPGAAAMLQAREIDRANASAGALAQNDAGGMSGGPGGYSDARPGPSASVADVPPSMAPEGAGAGGAPGYTPAPPRQEQANVSQDHAGVGGAPGRYYTNREGPAFGERKSGGTIATGGMDGEALAPGEQAPPDGGGGAMGAPGMPPPATRAGAVQIPATGGAAAGQGQPKLLNFAAVSGRSGGGGGAPAGPREMLASRQITIEGKISPETKAMQEAVIRQGGELAQRAENRGQERAALDRNAEEIIAGRAQKFDDDAAARRAEGQRVLDDLAARRAAKLAEIESGKIDPKKFYAERSTGQKVAAIFAIALGAVAKGLAGGKGGNIALEMFDKAIDRDLDAQAKNLEKKKWEAGSLGEQYAAEKARLGDDIAARNEVKITALARLSSQAKRLAAIPNNEDQAIKAREFALKTDAQIADLRAKNEDRIKEVQTFKTALPGGGGKKKPETGFTVRDPQTGKEKYIPFTPGLSEGQKNDVFKRIQGLNNAARTLGRLKEVRGAGLPIDDADARAFAQSYTYEYAEGKGQGQATADQEKSVAEKVTGLRGHKAIDAYDRNLADSTEELIRQFGARGDE